MSNSGALYQDARALYPPSEGKVFSAAEIPQTLLFSVSIDGHSDSEYVGDTLALLGIATTRMTSPSDLLLRYVHRDDKFRILQGLEATLRGEQSFAFNYRWNTPGQRPKRLFARACLIPCKTRPVLRGFITEQLDTSTQRNSSDTFSSDILSLMGEFSFVTDMDLRVTMASKGSPMPSLLGESSFVPDLFRTGAPLTSFFSSAQARERCSALCDRASSDPENPVVLDWQAKSNHYIGKILAADYLGAPSLVFSVHDISAFDRAKQYELKATQSEKQLQFMHSGRESIHGNLQTILSYAGILKRKDTTPILSHAISQEIINVAQSTYGVVGAYLSDLEMGIPRIKYSIQELIVRISKSFMQKTAKSPLILVRPGEIPNTPTARSVIENYLPKILTEIQSLEPREIEIDLVNQPGINRLRFHCSCETSVLFNGFSAFSERLRSLASVNTAAGVLIQCDFLPHGAIDVDLQLPASSNEGADQAEMVHQATTGERVLLVGGDRASRTSLGLIVSDCGFRSISVGDGEEAMRIIRSAKREIGLAIVDTQLRDISAARLLQQLRRTSPTLYFLGVVNSPEENTSLRRAGALATVQKPFEPPALRLVLSHLRKLKLLAA